jgi:Uma2 family endonuclease
MPRGERRYELVRGVLISKPLSENLEGNTVARLSAAICKYADDHDYGCTCAGEPGFWLERDPDTVRAPQVAWAKPGRIPGGTKGYPEVAPDLAVEVKSRHTADPEMDDKAAMWLSYGSQEVWVANPETTTVTRHRPNAAPETLGEDDILDGGDLLPGFTTPVWRLFRQRQ